MPVPFPLVAIARAVVASPKVILADEPTGNLHSSQSKEIMDMFKKLNDEGLLEAYILLARPDAGIVKDHPAYLRANRDKLRRYVLNYVSKGGGD